MELALYCPDCGYYEKENDTIGRRGDFYTSVSVGPLFGELLAFQFAEWLAALNPQLTTLNLVEAGAHDGRLAKDILNWLRRRRPALFERVEYSIIEPSLRRREWQRETLKTFPNVRWLDSELATYNRQLKGVIFANELLDALPVHRLGWDAKRREWFEWGVSVEGERFVWTRLPEKIQSVLLPPPPADELQAVLPDGFTTEVGPAAQTWWEDAAQALKSGKLLTIDYGGRGEELFQPARANGTLRAYHRHRASDDLLAQPGGQDLTAHVNFTAIQTAGENAGLNTEAFASQAQFLTGIAQQVWQDGSDFGPWTSEHTRQFHTLTHPEHLGRAFRTLIQSR